ncbi:MAG: dienelactone hydrolase family protein [Alphaproteobacteria bacterium]|nr:dienelactone hydrolase family protein [Alphaproteobacteria bacterium]
MTPLRVAALAAALLLAACAAPAKGYRIAAPQAADPPVLRIYAPDDGARHPAVLIVPGCEAPLLSARAAFYERLAERLEAEGFAAAILAWPGSGSGDPSCRTMTAPATLARTIAGALGQLRATARVDPERLHLAGWAWGGRGVLEVVMAEQRLPGLVSAAAFYPPCPAARPWRSAVTLQLFLAEKDAVAPPAACRDWADLSDGPGPVVITRYVGVGHGFDIDEAGDPRFAPYRTGAPIAFDASTAWQSWLDLLKFLRLALPSG